MVSTAPRRGLPRVKGGDPWPPADFAPDRAAASPPAAPAVAAPAPARAAVPETPAPATAPAAGVSAPAAAPASSEAPAAAAASGAPAVLRRGLPRVAGGDPWPPADFAPVAATAASAPAKAASAPAAPADSNTPSEAPAATPAPVPAAPAAGTAPSADPTAGTAATLRRGLPRVAGGDPWPPADFTPVVVEQAAAPVEQPAAGEQAPAAAPAPVAAETATPVAPVPAVVPAQKPRPAISRVAQATLDRAGNPGQVDEPEERSRFRPYWHQGLAGLLGLAALGLVAFTGVFLVRLLLSTDAMQAFLATYPGEYHPPFEVAEGFPAWARWQHFLNFFFIVLIIRSGLQVRNQNKPPAYWASKRGSKISINLWFHQALDVLWLANGVIFVVLLFVTGHWARIVPTSWEVFPNALSAVLQYVSLDWPVENGWVNYNALQQLAYFATVFIAAPLAAITGVRMSGVWPKGAKTLSRIYPVEVARAIHFPVMLYFVVFVIFHVALVFATGALRNLNHMYAGADVVNWAGFWIFLGSVVLVIAAWVAARPLVLAPIAGLFGRVSER